MVQKEKREIILPHDFFWLFWFSWIRSNKNRRGFCHFYVKFKFLEKQSGLKKITNLPIVIYFRFFGGRIVKGKISFQ